MKNAIARKNAIWASRNSEASRYTERDTPIFVGQQVAIRAALDALDGAASRVEA